MEIVSKKYRLTLSEAEYHLLKEYITFNEMKDKIKELQTQGYSIYDDLLNKINKPTEIKFSVKKSLAADKATEVRTKKAKAKIDNAINILRIENKPITHYSIAKVGKVSYNTVKKYITLDEMNQIEEG